MNRREFLLATTAAALAPSLPAADEFAGVPKATRLRMHWWVFGMAWTKDEAARQLELMSEAHIGSVLIFPAHPYEVDNPARGVHNQQFLRGEFFDTLNAVIAKSRSLRLVLDIVAGTGWPYGGPSVTVEDASRMLVRLRLPVSGGEAVQLPVLKPGEHEVGVFHVRPDGARDVASLVHASRVAVPGSVPGSEIQYFYSAPTGQQVKRASAGAEGLVLDHYNGAALRRYMDVVGAELLAGTPPHSFRSFFCDSMEVYRANWTNAFPQLFEQRRGYDILAHLPALFDDAHPDSPQFRYDLWRTLSDLAKEEFTDPLAAWGKEHGIQVQVEAYGAPPIGLAGFQNVDIPCGEGFNWRMFNFSRWGASGGRLAGKRMIADEGWTWLGYPDRFGDSLEGLKVASDLQFLCGVNETYGVSYGYSPLKFGAPGWPPYFGPIVNHTQPYWPLFSHFADYIARTQYVLQKGIPVTDIAVYLGEEDSFAGAAVDELQFRFNQQFNVEERDRNHRLRTAVEKGADVITTICTNGYSFDFVDGSIFRAGLRTARGRLSLGDGDYSVLVMPNVAGVDVDVLEAVVEFVKGGGTLIVTRRAPDTAYGWKDHGARAQRVRELIRQLFGPGRLHGEMRAHALGSGKSIFCPDEEPSLLEALRSTIAADIDFDAPSRYVGFQHRRTDDRDFYFIANTCDRPYQGRASFRSARAGVEFWNPRTGAVTRPAMDGKWIEFELEPYESRFAVFSDAAGSAPPQPVRITTNRRGAVPELPAPLLLEPRWRLRFKREGMKPVELSRLESWTSLSAARYFSGEGIYEAEFSYQKPAANIRVLLDLGTVRETAAVEINGQSAGVAWMRPFQLEVTDLLRTGTNRISVAVTNLLINKVLGDGPIDYAAVIARYGDRFPGGDEWEDIREPLPSGLLGPVRLIFYREET